MIFVLDNYDSFTYNLVQYLGELGAEVVVRRNDAVTVKQVEALAPARILLSPGPCTPQEAGISIARAPRLMHGKTSAVEHDSRTIFRGIPSPMICTRYHSLIVSEDGLPEELEISARADGLIMGLRHRKYPVEGVQFHPESVLTQNGKRMIANFLKLE
jgi:anthranilate/para-aminobenzoate synthase component II